MTSIGPKQWRALAKPRNKYNAHPTVFMGMHFPSKLEAAGYAMLWAREQAGEISDLARQPTIRFKALDISYKADAVYFNKTQGRAVYVEFKGVLTDRWRLIKKIWKVMGPGPLEVYRGTASRLRLVETIIPTVEP